MGPATGVSVDRFTERCRSTERYAPLRGTPAGRSDLRADRDAARQHGCSRAGEGVVSSLQFSNRLEELILGVFVISLSTVILPEFSTDVKEGRWDNFNKNLVFGIKLTAMISIPAMIFTLLMKSEIV